MKVTLIVNLARRTARSTVYRRRERGWGEWKSAAAS